MDVVTYKVFVSFQQITEDLVNWGFGYESVNEVVRQVVDLKFQCTILLKTWNIKIWKKK